MSACDYFFLNIFSHIILRLEQRKAQRAHQCTFQRDPKKSSLQLLPTCVQKPRESRVNVAFQFMLKCAGGKDALFHGSTGVKKARQDGRNTVCC